MSGVLLSCLIDSQLSKQIMLGNKMFTVVSIPLQLILPVFSQKSKLSYLEGILNNIGNATTNYE